MPRTKKQAVEEQSPVEAATEAEATAEAVETPKETKAVKSEPVLVATEGRFSLYEDGEKLVIKDALGRVICYPVSKSEGKRKLYGLAR